MVKETITEKDLDRARKSKHSILNTASRLDIWTKFKISCLKRGITARTGMNEAIRLWLKENE